MAHTNLILDSQAAFSALTTADIKTHLNITDSGQDSYVASLLSAAVVYVERRLQLDLRHTEWTLELDQFPMWNDWTDRYGNQYSPPLEYGIGRAVQRWQGIPLNRGPLVSVDQVAYFDTQNTATVLDASKYIHLAPSFGHAYIEPLQYWPVAYSRGDAVAIAFTTGFVTTGGSGSGASTTVPTSILHAIKLICGMWYSQREDISYGAATVSGATGCAVEALLDQFTVTAVG